MIRDGQKPRIFSLCPEDGQELSPGQFLNSLVYYSVFTLVKD